jgi:hypothetical protein
LNAGTTSALVVRWNGTEWKQQTIKEIPGGSVSVSSGVSCPTASFCAAVGGYSEAGVDRLLVETWNGTEWSIQKPKMPSGGPPEGKLSVSLSDISCFSSSTCTAAGWYYWSVKGVMQTRYTLAQRYYP